MTLKPGLGVTQGHQNRQVLIRHLYAFLLTGLSLTVSAIEGDLSRKSQIFFPLPCILRPRWRGSLWNWLSAQGVKKTRMIGLSDGRKSFKIDLAV